MGELSGELSGKLSGEYSGQLSGIYGLLILAVAQKTI